MKKTAYSRFLARAAVTLLAVFSFSGARAQEIVTIGEGTVTCNTNPIGTYYNYSITEQLYTAEEIGMAGTIESISFYYMGIAAKDLPITMYMKHVDAENLASAISLADADQVFSGTLSVTTTAGWVTITLDTPFEYDGESNLLIGVVKDYLKYFSGQTWQGTATSATMARYTQTDSQAFDTSTVPGTTQANRPNIQIGITPSTDCPKPNNFVVSNITAHTAVLTWETEASDIRLQYKKASEENWNTADIETGNTYTLSGLDPETEYQARVQAHSESCGTDPETGDDIYSAFREITFTTLAACFAPTNLAVTDGSITAREATVTWEGTSDSYVVMIGEEGLAASADFETGDLSQADFTTTTSYPFTVVADTHSGAYCAKSSNDGVNSTTSDMVLEVTLSSDATLSFSAKVSSESGWDKAYFSIDGTVQSNLNAISGAGNWIDYSYPLTAGTHTLRWYYTKDNSTAGYDDCFYVDDIVVSAGVASWSEYTTNAQTYTFENLTPNRSYQVKVKGNCGDDGYSQASVPVGFTTLESCVTPTALAASNISAYEATITWTSDAEAWQICVNDDEEHLIDVTETTYTLTGFTPQTTYNVKVRTNCGNEYSDWTKNVGFTTLESCVTPTNLAASNISANEATITWTSDADAWQICVNDDEEHLIDVTGEATHTLTGLTPQTTYNVKVRTNCGNEYSNWKTMTFTTACGAVTTFPWSDDFESYEASSQGITFDHPCWVNEHISGNGSNFFEIYSGTAMDGNSTKTLRLHDMSSGTLTKLMLPEMTLPGDNYLFSIDVFRNNSQENYGEGIRVFVSTDGEIEGATELAFISRSYTTSDGNLIPAESASGWYTYEIPLGISGTCYIILRGESQYGSATYMDNFAVEMVPTCRKPAGVNASDVTNHTATIGWTSDATEWVVAYKAGADEDFTEIPAVTENSYTLTGLAAETTYTVKVRTNCGGGDYSDWTAPVNFTTDIACPVPTALLSDNISSTSTELSWTSDASQWDIAYKADGEEEFTEITGVTQKPYSLEGLNPETTYTWKVRAYYPEEEDYTPYSAWTTTSSFTSYGLCPTPTNLHTTAVRSTSADLDWKGSIDVDYSVRYRVPQHVADGIYETFDANSLPANWSRYNGKLNEDGTATLNGSSSGFSFGESKGVFDSHARLNIYGTGFYKWLITPVITMSGSTLSFDMALTAYSGSDVSAPDTNGTDDKFIVLISTDNMATWTILREWNNSGSEYVYNDIANSATGEPVYIDLSSYVGQEIRIAFYGESTASNADNYLHIDNVLIGQMVPATEWVTVGTTETEATLTGLTPRTPYEVQVKSNCSDPEAWSTTLKFTTLTNFELANDDSQAEAEGKNSAIIAANVGNKADVTLSGRTLYKDGNWNTICLPFDVVDGDFSDELTFTGTPLEGAIAKMLTDAEVTTTGDRTHISLTFGDDVTSLDAGIPYIIKWEPEENADIVNPVFSGVTIVETSNEHRIISPAYGVWFIGYYDAFGIGETDTNIFYMTSDNQLKYTASDRTLKSCRAYFRFSDATPKARTFTLNFGDGSEATGIISTKNSPDSTNDGWYTVDGMKLGKQPKRKGVYIHNGRKVVIK